jgi:chemotaxis protein MotB
MGAAGLAARSKRRGDAEHENTDRWLLTYADMITLLMVLFVVMYAISNTDLRKFSVLAQSVSAAFNLDVLQGTELITISDAPNVQSDAGQFDSGSGAIATDYRAVQATLRDYAITQGQAGDVSVDRVPEGIAIRISDGVLFQSGRASLDPASRGVLGKIFSVLAGMPNSLRVEGHTDDLPPTGPFYGDNWSLSTARALAVLQALGDLGIAQERLAAAGYAGYRPLVPNTDEAARARNRRVDILILYAAASAPSPADTGVPFPSGGLP